MAGRDHGGMRIALVTEEFLPSGAPAARVTREIVTHLVDGGHDVTVFAAGRGQSTFRGARIFWASRMTSVGSVREAMALARPDVCHLIDPRRLGIKAAEAAERLGVPTRGAGPQDLDARRRPRRPPPRAPRPAPPRPVGARALPRRRPARGRPRRWPAGEEEGPQPAGHDRPASRVSAWSCSATAPAPRCCAPPARR